MINKLIFFLLISFAANDVSAQKNLDSLWSAWENESFHDTLRIQAIRRFNILGYLNSKPDSAIYFAQLQYDYAFKIGSKRYMIDALMLEGNANAFLGNFKEAVKLNLRSLEIAKSYDNYSIIVKASHNIGLNYYGMGQFDSALNYFNIAVVIADSTGMYPAKAAAFNALGMISRVEGNFAGAINYYESALVTFQLYGMKKDAAVAYNNLGNIYMSLGDYIKADSAYHRSLRAASFFVDQKIVGNSLSGLGALHLKKNNIDSAIVYHLKCYELMNATGDARATANALHYLANDYLLNNEIDKSIEMNNKALVIYRKVDDQAGIAGVLIQLGQSLNRKGYYAEALEKLTESFSIVTKINSPELFQEMYSVLIKSYSGRSEFDLALPHGFELLKLLNKSILFNFPVLNEKEKELYFATKELFYGQFYQLANSSKSSVPSITDHVYNSVLMNKGILLKSSTALKNSIYAKKNDAVISMYEEWIDLKKKLIRTFQEGKETAILEAQADSLEKLLVKYSISELGDGIFVENLIWQDVANQLKPNEAAIEFVHFNADDTSDVRIYCALIVTQKSEHPEMIELCNESQLEKILGTYQGNNLNYINSVYGKRNKNKSDLYDLIWKPIDHSLQGIKKVYVSPSGLLHRVSFAALSKEQDVFLCDNYSIQMVASTGKVALPESFVFDENTSTLIFGGIDYSTDSSEQEIWNYLIGTELEGQKISQLFKKQQLPVSYLSQSDATESEFKNLASKTNILHIATHGFFYPDPNDVIAELEIDSTESVDIKFRGRGFGYSTFVENENPLMRSGLVFAGANDVWSTKTKDGEDGVLTAQEVAHIDMRNTQLVVLSACETGLGDIKGSEGVYGLQRAFKMAGVKFIIMSLWQVPDKETAEFMTLFYKRLIKLKDIHLAFNQTQKAMRAKYDPYYWAAFVLIE